MTLEFLPTDDINDEFLDKLFPTGTPPDNSIFRLRDATKKILNDPNQIFEVEFEPGMNLNGLARDYLGDSFLWESIGILNDVKDPTEEIPIGKILKVPTVEQVRSVANKIIAPEVNKIIDSVKGSILDLTGLNTSNSKFSNNLKDCVNKIIDFKVSF
jgi:hypothetical protein